MEGRLRTLWTRIVPAKPLRPAMPRGGGRAQSSPTITVYKIDHVILSTSSLPKFYNNKQTITSTLKPSVFACSAARPKFKRSPV